MARAYRCNVCTEYYSGKPDASGEVGPFGTPEEHTFDLCADCYKDMKNTLNLSNGTIDL